MTTAIQPAERSPCVLNTPYSPSEFWHTKQQPESGALIEVSHKNGSWPKLIVVSDFGLHSLDPEYSGRLNATIGGINFFDELEVPVRIRPGFKGKIVDILTFDNNQDSSSTWKLTLVATNYFEYINATEAALPSILHSSLVHLIQDYLS